MNLNEGLTQAIDFFSVGCRRVQRNKTKRRSTFLLVYSTLQLQYIIINF